MQTFRSYSFRETVRLGSNLARHLIAAKLGDNRGALVIALQGDLGAGKTTFTQGFARGLGIRRRTASPTFVIMRKFLIPARTRQKNHFKHLYHIDAYRLKKQAALKALGFKELLADPSAIVVIEWPENIKRLLPRETAWLKFRCGKKENERIIAVR